MLFHRFYIFISTEHEMREVISKIFACPMATLKTTTGNDEKQCMHVALLIHPPLHSSFQLCCCLKRMANVTDPLARPIHGTNPQNLIEYITRQRIYDSQYWKESCFGLTAADVAEKAATQIQAIGGSYGGNSKPTRFLCLILKMLQIQPDDQIIDKLITNKNFKYVTALGAFYLRLTGCPSDIYEKLEPLYGDYRKLKFRHTSDWSLIRMDSFIDQLLNDERVCGIALPRLPKRSVLVDAGYLDGERESSMKNLIGISIPKEEDHQEARYNQSLLGVQRIEDILLKMADSGIEVAKSALVDRGCSFDVKSDYATSSTNDDKDVNVEIEKYKKRSAERREKTKIKKNKFGSLFKRSAMISKKSNIEKDNEGYNCDNSSLSDKQDEKFWDEERSKLGLKPLRK
jgi:pre-mRNA-splicing factor 38A